MPADIPEHEGLGALAEGIQQRLGDGEAGGSHQRRQTAQLHPPLEEDVLGLALS